MKGRGGMSTLIDHLHNFHNTVTTRGYNKIRAKALLPQTKNYKKYNFLSHLRES